MYVIGITGLSCSGKTELSLNLSKHFKDECLLLSMDDYYKDLTPEQSQLIYDDSACINFDEPAAIDFDKFVSHLTDIIDSKPVTIPKYDLGSCVVTEHVLIEANKYKFIVVEGVFIFSDARLREMCHLKVWVETSEYVCALRRFIKYTRDIQGYSPEFVYAQCIKHVIPGLILDLILVGWLILRLN